MKKNTEASIIKKISAKFPPSEKNIIKGIGDDAAVVKTGGKQLLFTCDALVEDIHFTKKYFTPYQIGQKATAVNISDIAAMGGKPRYLLVSLFLPKGTTEKFVDELYRGIRDECHVYNINVIGGNIAQSRQLIIDIFLIGEAVTDNIIYRSGAKIGNKVLVTGTLGKNGAWYKVPTPRLYEGILISRSNKATAMIDVSDGLSTDLLHICKSSQVGVKLYADKIPTDNIERALTGGEDYELCFTANVSHIKNVKATVIGEITSKTEGCWLIDKKGNKSLLKPKGWDHLQR